MFRGTAIHNIFEASVGFRVGWGTAGGGVCRGDWALGYHSLRFKDFPDVS